VKTRPDRWLLSAAVVLTLWGLVIVYSSSSAVGELVIGKDSQFFIQKQVVKAAVGLAFMFAASLIPLRRLRGRLAYLIWGGTVVVLGLLVAGRLMSGKEEPARWVYILGGQVQPAEFARLALIMALAATLCRLTTVGRLKDLFYPGLLIIPVVVLVYKQPNLSMAIVLGASALSVLFLAGCSWPWLAGLSTTFGALGFSLKMEYQAERIRTWLAVLGRILKGEVLAAPNEQVEQALIALGSGGVIGTGVGRGLQKFKFLSQPHTDFILSIHGEETGFIGFLILIALEIFIVWRILRIGARAQDPFAQLLCYGIGIQIAILVVIHTAVNFGVGPTTGVPLPFISYGGSALVANLIGVGLVLAVSRQEVRTVHRPPLDAGPARWRTT
jgi:cell division protein FtsW (lipid II flippase)